MLRLTDDGDDEYGGGDAAADVMHDGHIAADLIETGRVRNELWGNKETHRRAKLPQIK